MRIRNSEDVLIAREKEGRRGAESARRLALLPHERGEARDGLGALRAPEELEGRRVDGIVHLPKAVPDQSSTDFIFYSSRVVLLVPYIP